MTDAADRIIASRAELLEGKPRTVERRAADEGGCGVTGFACSIPIRGQHIYEPSVQMHNRGNGKGGGIAAAGLVAEDVGVTQEVLDSHYLLQIALLDPKARGEVEEACIAPYFDVALSAHMQTVDDYRDVPGMEIKPPDVQRYLLRVKPDVLTEFAEKRGLADLPSRDVEDEFVYRNSVRLNEKFYASLGEQRAFVLSHGRNLVVFKIVGYAEQIVQYYRLEDFRAHVWIAHQRYPTKGRVWHPGGAHPFVGLNEALVHNGDFANYHSVAEYLLQRNIRPQFLTDTEVSALLFDLWSRVYKYPLEYVIEALAPTTERDFDQLPEEKQLLYRRLQAAHIHGSPDGPWFFIIARSLPDEGRYQLLGITDTAMLRPQVFALADGDVQIGLICSEKQAIDATLHSLAAEDARFCPVADKYWNARGGSHTDGGAFLFNVEGNGHKTLTCTDKFGRPVTAGSASIRCDVPAPEKAASPVREAIRDCLARNDAAALYEYASGALPTWQPDGLRSFCDALIEEASEGEGAATAIETLTLLRDRRYDTGDKRRSSALRVVDEALTALFEAAAPFGSASNGSYRKIDWQTRGLLAPPQPGEETLIVNVEGFPPEGDDCDAVLVRRAYEMGWRRFICHGYRGQRFAGCGLGAETLGVRIDVYGSSGDYLASGIDGLSIFVHGNGQDQLGQIMNRGKLVVHGDVGQTFLYGAKGGDVYVLGNAAGRPLINAVGRPRVVINGTCLDFLAESFMAGDPLDGGGFAIVNGMEFDERCNLIPQPAPYPGGNLFSLASGGAIYVRDPLRQVDESQLNGGELGPLTDDDWLLIRPYLEENERLFGISVEALLTVDGVARQPKDVYRKVGAVRLGVLTGKAVEVEADDFGGE
jgi:glutamate synthase domain-containing protein 1/glutamate synthase domain-containing protein 3